MKVVDRRSEHLLRSITKKENYNICTMAKTHGVKLMANFVLREESFLHKELRAIDGIIQVEILFFFFIYKNFFFDINWKTQNVYLSITCEN